jgi:PIN domain nuclease of toxin-antitoxin system
LSLLLDTHVVLWWVRGERTLTTGAYAAIERKAASVLVSAASIWEIEVKRLKGKLTAPVDLLERIETHGFRLLALTPDNMLDAARLPRHHGDPFDRFLVAQAQAEAATLVSDDAALAAYDVPVMRASARG